MNDKIVTHADLPLIEDIEAAYGESGPGAALLARLRAVAKADAPPLPEGWVLFRYRDGANGVFYYPGHGDVLTRYDDGNGESVPVEAFPDRLTPLRPTVTEADIEKAAIAYMSNGEDTEWDGDESEAVKSHARFAVRTVLTAVGIEVSDR